MMDWLSNEPVAPDGTVFVIDPRKVPSLGHSPSMLVRGVYADSNTNGPNDVTIPVKVIDPFEVVGKQRGLFNITINAYTSRGVASSRYQGSYKQTNTSSIELSNPYIEGSTNTATAKIENIACNFTTQNGGGSYYNGDYYWTFDAVVSCGTAGTAAIYYVDVLIEDIKVLT